MSFFKYRHEQWMKDVFVGLDLRNDKSLVQRFCNDYTGSSAPTSGAWAFKRINQSGTRFNIGSEIQLGSWTNGSLKYTQGDWTLAMRLRMDEASTNSGPGLWNGFGAPTAGQNYYAFTDGNAYLHAFTHTRILPITLNSNIDRTKWHTLTIRASMPRTSPTQPNGPWELWQNESREHNVAGTNGGWAASIQLGFGNGFKETRCEMEWFGCWNRWVSDSGIGWLSRGNNPWVEDTSVSVFFPGLAVPSGGAIAISVQSATHSHTADSPAISQTHVVTVDEAAHSHTADSPAITQTHVISVADADHGHTADNVTITIGGVAIAPADADHAHSADSPAITQTHIVAVNDATHGHTADTSTVTVGGVTVSPQDTNHGHTADSPLLSQTHIIAVADAVHSHLADSPAVTQTHVIVVQDALHGHAADNVTVTIGVLFVPPGLESIVDRSPLHTIIPSRLLHTSIPEEDG